MWSGWASRICRWVFEWAIYIFFYGAEGRLGVFMRVYRWNGTPGSVLYMLATNASFGKNNYCFRGRDVPADEHFAARRSIDHSDGHVPEC